MRKDFLSIADLTNAQLGEIFALTDKIKKNKWRFSKSLTGKALALIFQKPSNRTRVSFEVGMYQLGGAAIYLGPDEINLGVRESVEDIAKTLSRYIDGIVLRTFEHKNILELAGYAAVPVINGLSDLLHPCQALADIYTVRENFKKIKGITVAYIGDGNNVCNSLLHACVKTGVNINVATPKGYEPDRGVSDESRQIAKSTKAKINLYNRPEEAIKDADVVYTDVWVSMGQEEESGMRKELFKGFQINKSIMKLAKNNALVMHCLPAHRGEEITDDVMRSRNSVIFDQAENRLHVQKAILIRLLGDKKWKK